MIQNYSLQCLLSEELIRKVIITPKIWSSKCILITQRKWTQSNFCLLFFKDCRIDRIDEKPQPLTL